MSRVGSRNLNATCSIALFFRMQSREVKGISLLLSGTLSFEHHSFSAGLLQGYVDTATAALFGLILLMVLVAVALYVKQTRRRMAVLELALGPDGVLAVQEAERPARTHKEIVESLNWLEEVYERIPTMDNESLASLEHEMRNSVEILSKSVNRDANMKQPEDSLSRLKRALLIRTRLVLETVAREIASRS